MLTGEAGLFLWQFYRYKLCEAIYDDSRSILQVRRNVNWNFLMMWPRMRSIERN